MDQPALHDPVLDRFRRAVLQLYGDRLERVVLFGSRARGDARPDSDYDVAVFLKGYTGLWSEPFRAGEHEKGRPLMREIARDGREL